MTTERILAEAMRLTHHRPIYPGEFKGIEPTPYLRLPFRQSDLARVPFIPGQSNITHKINYEISEGWFYSKDVTRIVPYKHGAVDFALPYGFPVVAPCDGLAMSSYYSYPILDRQGNITRDKDGHMLSFGIGYFVQIYNIAQDRFVQLGHLSNIADPIPFSPPIKVGNRWEPTNHVQKPKDMDFIDNNTAIFVKAGETVGYVGYSGLTWEADYKEGYDRPYQINRMRVKTWSEPHLHMDEFQRNYKTLQKAWRRDLYGIYQKREAYPTHSNKVNIGKEPLFLTDVNDRPLYADS